MLSQKLQKDLMNAYASVHEEKRGHAAGASDTEKQASQLASDVRYKARAKVKPGASDEEKKKVFLQILGASPAPNSVKAMAKSKLLGEGVADDKMIFGKGAARNERRFGEKGKFDPQGSGPRGQDISQRAKLAVQRKKEHEARRGVKTGTDTYTPSGKMGEEVVHEERFPDGKEGTAKRLKALAKKRKIPMDKMKKHPQFQPEEFSKTGMTKGSGKPGGAMKKYLENAKKKKEKVKMEGYMSKDKYTHDTGGFRISQKDADEAKARIKKKMKMKKEEVELGEMSQSTSKKTQEKKITPEVLKKIRATNTGAGSQYEQVMNEFKMTPKKGKSMDPVGQEDGDINNDGKKDGTDKYLASRRKAIGKAIAKKRGKVKEGFSAWRIDLDFNEQVKK